MELQAALHRRKMVRSFLQEPVPRDVIDKVMSSVLHAPSAGFTQGNEFLVLDTPAAVADFFRLTNPETDADLYPSDAPPTVVVLPLANKRAYLDRYSEEDKSEYGLGIEARWPVPYWDIDAGMASMLILLSAVDQGLGAWFSGIFEGEGAMLRRFGVPADLRPIGFIGLGYAADVDNLAPSTSSATRRRRTLGELLHFNSW